MVETMTSPQDKQMAHPITKPVVEIVEMEPDGTYGKFVLEPLERGYGITLGNSLRRVLLSRFPALP